MRLMVYEKQLNFYVKLFMIVGKIDNLLTDFNQPYSENQKILEQLDLETDALDLLFDQGEFLVPDNLFNETNQLVIQIWKITTTLYKEPEKWSRELLKEFTDSVVEFEEDVREYLGIRKLSEENNRLARRIGRG